MSSAVPGDLTQAEIATLKTAGDMSTPEHLRIDRNVLNLTIPASTHHKRVRIAAYPSAKQA